MLEQVPVQLHLFRMLAYTQSALTPTPLLGKAILAEQELAAELRELAILQVAKQANADYEWVQCVPIARAAGVTDEQIALVEQGRQELQIDLDPLPAMPSSRRSNRNPPDQRSRHKPFPARRALMSALDK